MVAQRTLTPYVRVQILLPLPNNKCHPLGGTYFFGGRTLVVAGGSQSLSFLLTG